MSKTFVDLTLSIGASGTFWLYAGVCLLGSIFTFIFVPETKGKSIEEIQKMFFVGGIFKENYTIKCSNYTRLVMICIEIMSNVVYLAHLVHSIWLSGNICM